MSLLFCQQGHQNPEGSNFCSVCGEPLAGAQTNAFNLPAVLPPGKRLRDRYVVRNTLGEGGFGRTYLIEDTGRFDERLVLKEFLPSVQGTAALQKSVELFQREAVTLYRLKHEQIPKFWEVFQSDSRLFLVEDFVEGYTYEALLNQRIRNNEAFSETEILHLFRDLLPVLTYIHREGIIHRDISPDNIILSSKLGLPVLIDMGAAKQTVINATTTVHATSAPRPTMIGKTGYAPDEQIRLGIVAPYSDLYALAVTAIVLMSGKQPSQLLDQYTLMWNWEESITVNPTFAQVINRMLFPRPDQRFQSAEAVLQALGPLLNKSVDSPEVRAPTTAVSPTLETVINPTPTHHFVDFSTPAPVPNHAGSNHSGPNHSAPNHAAPNHAEPNHAGAVKPGTVPAEVRGWNWGAFLLGPIWGIQHKVWISLLFAPIHFCLYALLPAGFADAAFFADGETFIGGVFITSIFLLIASPLGIKGNVWAWNSKRWPSVETFKSRQKKWAVAGWIISPSVFFLFFLLFLATY